MTAPLLLTALTLLQAQVPKPTVMITAGRQLQEGLDLDRRILALQKEGRWSELAELFETLGPRERGDRLGLWLEALKKDQRWGRLDEVLASALPQLEAKGAKVLPERLLRAVALERLGRRAEALAAYFEVGELGDAQGYLMAGNLGRAMGRDDVLLRAAQALCSAFPRLAQGWAWKGECDVRAGRWAEAEPALDTAVGLDPALAAAWANLGACRALRRSYPAAIEALDHAIALDRDHMQAHYNRGMARVGLRQFEAGREDLARALALAPADPAVRAQIQSALQAAEAEGRKQGRGASADRRAGR